MSNTKEIGERKLVSTLQTISKQITILTNTAYASSSGGGTATDTTVVTTNFDNNLSAADDTVQKSLETIDDLVIGTGDVTKVGTPVSDQIGIWTGDGTIEGESTFTFSNSLLRVGTDSGLNAGTLFLYGNNTTTSGKIRLYNGATVDDDDNFYEIDSNLGIFALSGFTTGNFLTYTSATQILDLPKVNQMSAYGGGTIVGTPTYGLAVDVSGNLIETPLATGDVTKVGTPVDNQVGVWTGDGTIEGDADFTYTNATITLGITASSFGKLYLRGNTSTSGGQIEIYNGANFDTNGRYVIGSNSGNLRISEPFGAGDIITYTSATEVLDTARVTKISSGYTVAGLPTGAVGQRAYVTDATAPTYLGTLTGGGAVTCPVFHNGTAWVSA